MPTLLEISKEAEVACLQDALRAHGFDPGPTTGVLNANTVAAVKAFQRSEGLNADGIAGARTKLVLGLIEIAEPPEIIPGVTVRAVLRMFPRTPLPPIQLHLPYVLNALAQSSLTDKPMVLMALATIRAETEGFKPISENQSKYNTSPGGLPFDKYDHHSGLGNLGPPDGERFRGRGFIQLTGRANYRKYGIRLGLNLLDEPELANDPTHAARLLSTFLKDRESKIKIALGADELNKARRLVNGGSHGLVRFTDAYRRGQRLLG